MLTRLDLHSFKCFAVLRLPLAPLTLLTGLNASGKSSVLQALALLHQTMREREWSTRLGLNGSDVRLGAATDVVDDVEGSRSFEIALHDEENVCEWVFRGTPHEMSMVVQRVSVNGRTSEQPQELRYLMPSDENRSATSLTRLVRDLTYITAERIAPQSVYALEDPHSISVVGPRGEHAASILYWGSDEPALNGLILPGSPNTLLRQVEERMRTLFPGCTLDLQPALQSNTVTLGLRTTDATRFHRPANTGFGLTQVLPIVVAALSASKGDIILIENPEVHLHPAGQTLMGQFMAEIASAGIQVILETHSDHVLNGVRRAVKDDALPADQVGIHFFRPRSEEHPQVLSPTLDDSGNIDDWPEGFFDQFDKDSSYFAGWGWD